MGTTTGDIGIQGVTAEMLEIFRAKSCIFVRFLCDIGRGK